MAKDTSAKATEEEVVVPVEETKEKEVAKEEVVKEEVTKEETVNEVAVTEEVPAEVVPFGGMNLEDLGFSPEELQELTGLDSMDSSEISIPYATLISKVTKDHKVGDIVFPDGSVVKGAEGEVVESISILNIQPVRVYFPQPFSPKNSFICRSLDGEVAAEDGQFAGRKCETCEFAQYPEAGGASPCRHQRLLLCAREDGSLFHLQVGGVGVGVWKKFMSAQVFHLLSKIKKAYGAEILGAINVNISVKMIDTDFGPFPALDFKTNTTKPFHDVERLKEHLSALRSYKDFVQHHASSAAVQTKVEMAAGGADSEGTGKNTNLF